MKNLSVIKKNTLLSLLAAMALTACKHQDTTSPQRKNIIDAVFGSGHIENYDQYSVMANTDGYLKEAYVSEGDTVKANQKLYRLSNEVQQTQVSNALTNLEFARTNTSPKAPQIEQLKIQIKQAKDRVQVDSLNYERYSRLIKTHAVAATDYDNARLNYQNSTSNLQVLQKNLADLQRTVNNNLQNANAQYRIQQENNNYNVFTSKSPGVVMNVTKKPGDYVRKGDAVALVGAGRPIIKLDISEDDINRIQLGQEALISLNSVKDKVYKSKISKIYPAFNTNDQSFVVEATFTDEAPHRLLNGTQLQANIIVQRKNDALVIPSYYLINGGYVLLKGSKTRKPVQTGIRTLEWTEITGGLTTSDVLTLPAQQQ